MFGQKSSLCRPSACVVSKLIDNAEVVNAIADYETGERGDDCLSIALSVSLVFNALNFPANFIDEVVVRGC